MTALHFLMAGLSSASLPSAFSADYYSALQQQLSCNASSSYPARQAESQKLATSSVSRDFETGFIVRSFAIQASLNRTEVPAPPRAAWEDVEPALQKISEFAALNADWDFEGAPAPDPRSISDSLAFLGGLPLGAWEAQLHADGSIMLERETPGELIELTFLGAGEVDAFIRNAKRHLSCRLSLADIQGWLASV